MVLAVRIALHLLVKKIIIVECSKIDYVIERS